MWAGQWSDWDDLGSLTAAIGSVPAYARSPLAIHVDGHIDVFVLSVGGTVFMRRMNLSAGSWGDWKNAGNPTLPGETSGFPVACEAFNAGHIFLLGTQGSVFGKVLPRGSTAFDWQHLGGGLKWGPAAVVAGKSLHLFGTDNSGVVRHNRFQAGPRTWGWQPDWDPVGGIAMPGEPAAVRVGDTGIHVFAPAVGELLHWHRDGATWNSKPSLPGDIDVVRAVSWGPNRIDLFVKASLGSSVYHRSWNGVTWSPEEEWEDLGGDVYSDQVPCVVTWGPNRLDVFVLDAWFDNSDVHNKGHVRHCWLHGP